MIVIKSQNLMKTIPTFSLVAPCHIGIASAYENLKILSVHYSFRQQLESKFTKSKNVMYKFWRYTIFFWDFHPIFEIS